MSEVDKKESTHQNPVICHNKYGDDKVTERKVDKSKSVSRHYSIDAVSLHHNRTNLGGAEPSKATHQTRSADDSSKVIMDVRKNRTAEAEHRSTTPPEQTTRQEKEQILENAYKATKRSSAKQKHKKKSSGRLKFGQIVLALCCAGACVFAITYLIQANSTDFSMQVATMQVGFNASYPNFVPRDYTLSDISSEEGKVVMSFKNISTGDAFTITEEKSFWDSSALLSNFVESTYGNNYTTLQEQGLTIYISSGNAAWVNGGVAYKIKSTSGMLTKKLILSIATSLGGHTG